MLLFFCAVKLIEFTFTISQIKDAVATQKDQAAWHKAIVSVWRKERKKDNDNDIYFKIPQVFI